MIEQPNRRAFLKADLAADTALRPPGANQSSFRELCNHCGDCAGACPQAIIGPDDEGYPIVTFTRACTFCGDCADACETGALSLARLADWPWRAKISASCFSLNGVACRSCQDECDEDALTFRLKLGGNAEPRIDLDACTGCGACTAVCPAGAIDFENQDSTIREPVT